MAPMARAAPARMMTGTRSVSRKGVMSEREVPLIAANRPGRKPPARLPVKPPRGSDAARSENATALCDGRVKEAYSGPAVEKVIPAPTPRTAMPMARGVKRVAGGHTGARKKGR